MSEKARDMGIEYVKFLKDTGVLSKESAKEHEAPKLEAVINRLYNTAILSQTELVNSLNDWGELGFVLSDLTAMDISLEIDVVANHQVIREYDLVPLNATQIDASTLSSGGQITFIVPIKNSARVTEEVLRNILAPIYQTNRWQIEIIYGLTVPTTEMNFKYIKKFVDSEAQMVETMNLQEKVRKIFVDSVKDGTMDIVILTRNHKVQILRKYMNEFHPYGRVQFIGEDAKYLQNIIISTIAKIDVRRADSEPNLDFKIPDLIGDGQYEGRVNFMKISDGFQFHIRIIRLGLNDFTYDNYDLTPYVAGTMASALRSQQGVVLVTGPRGSGKQVFTYATINEYREVRPNSYIETLEDPVEAKLAGNVAQIEIDDLNGYDFNYHLSALKRHSTNLYFIGELRDKQTTEATINEAASSSLVISTTHTHDCAGTMKKLDAELGGDIELLQKLFNEFRAITNLTMAREACPYCADKDVTFDELDKHEKQFLASWGYSRDLTVTKANKGGCEYCRQNSYDKTGKAESDGSIYQPLIVVEGLNFDYEVKQLMLSHIDLNEQEYSLREYMIKNRIYKTQIALQFVYAGKLTLEECMGHFTSNQYTEEGAKAQLEFK